MLTAMDTQVEAAKHRLPRGIGKVDLLEGDASARPQQLPRAGAVYHLVILADHGEAMGNPGKNLGRFDRRKGEIARAVEDTKGDRHGQNHIAGADPSLAP